MTKAEVTRRPKRRLSWVASGTACVWGTLPSRSQLVYTTPMNRVAT